MTRTELEQGLKIDQDDLDTEIIQQPQLFYSACQLLSSAISSRDQLKDAYASEYTKACERARDHLERQQEKVTESRVQSLANADDDYLLSRAEYSRQREECDVLQGLKEAYAQRAYALKDLAHMQVAGASMSSSVGSAQARENSQRVSVAKEKLAEARLQRGGMLAKRGR